jgi:hypothetical protein
LEEEAVEVAVAAGQVEAAVFPAVAHLEIGKKEYYKERNENI